MPVKFFCYKCGKEMWYLVNWQESRSRDFTIGELLDTCFCTDCTLEEIREDQDDCED